MIRTSKERREIREIVDKQMREWEAEKGKQVERAHLAGDTNIEIDYVTISREVGSGGQAVGQALADHLKWRLYDKQILDYMAENMKVHKSVLESLDEKSTGWIESLFSSFRSRRSVDQMSYYQHLADVLLAIANHGNAIIMGRAAGLVLPRNRGLCVRVTASFDVRCRRYAQREGLSYRKAMPIVEKIDRDQRQFVKNMLDVDIDDTRHYDIVCNTDRFSAQAVAKLVWRTLDQRTGGELTKSGQLPPP